MSPAMCSHSGLIDRLTASIASERSVKVIAYVARKWWATLPPPEPSSSTVRGGLSGATSSNARRSATSST